MIKPAQKYKSELESLFYDTWYDDKYKYYRCSTYSDQVTLTDDNWSKHQFVSTNIDDSVIGYIEYSIHRMDQSVSNLVIINFTNEKLIFGKDLYNVLKNIFLKYNLRKLNFCVVVGNPIEASYDKWINKYGGRIVGTYYRDVMLDDGELYDRKIYEIFKEDFVKHIKNN